LLRETQGWHLKPALTALVRPNNSQPRSNFGVFAPHELRAGHGKLIPRLNNGTLALIVREIELPRGLGFGRPLIRGLNVASILHPRAQN
jgi:hypothetical protein